MYLPCVEPCAHLTSMLSRLKRDDFLTRRYSYLIHCIHSEEIAHTRHKAADLFICGVVHLITGEKPVGRDAIADNIELCVWRRPPTHFGYAPIVGFTRASRYDNTCHLLRLRPCANAEHAQSA